MIVIAVDDEALALKSLSDTIKKIRPDAEIYLFRDPLMALKSLESGVVKPDVIFSDIQMYDMTGIQFAHRVKVIFPHTNIVFVTGYAHYMMDAIRLHASGYLLKPIDEDQLREQFDNLLYPAEGKGNGQKFYAQTFGNFEFYCDGAPVHFARAKAKELLAYLVDKNGAACTRAELLTNVFDDAAGGDQSLSQAYSVLSKTLTSLGGGDIMIKSHNAYAINPDKFGCDYYDYLRGDVNAINAYQGAYMANYATWSDLTGPRKFRS